MNFQTAAKAMELKNLMDHAHQYLPNMGRCLSLELQYRREQIDGEEMDGDEEEYPKPEEIQDKLVKIYDLQNYRMENSGFEDVSINVLGKEIQALEDISLEDVKKWYAAGTNSGFGNVMMQETQHNDNIRSSRELDITQFTVSQKTLDDIALRWGEEFVPESFHVYTTHETLRKHGQKLVPESVMVQPYKIVIYGPGDHFQFHKDTPEQNLCGTFLISLYNNCKPYDAFEIRQHGKSSDWSGRWCAFYPDIPHRVKPLESGYRAVLSFKIYAKNQENPQEWGTNLAAKMQLESFVEEIQRLDVSVGILLNHHYGYDSKSIYGCDKLLLDALKRKGLDVDMQPVLIHFSGMGPYPGDYYRSGPQGSLSSYVYSITDEALEYVRKRLSGIGEEEFEKLSKEIVFFDGEVGNGDGLWEKEEEQSIEYTGNESQAHSEKSVYVRYAAIVQPASQND